MYGSILLIDPVPTQRIAGRVRLSLGHYETTLAETLTEALDCLECQQFDLILCALHLNDGGPLDLLKALARRESARPVPVVVQIQPRDTPDCAALLSAGVADILPRTISDTLFLAQLRRLIRTSTATHALDLHDSTSRALGLAEPVAEFSGKPQVDHPAPAQTQRIVVLSEHRQAATRWMSTLRDRPQTELRFASPADCLHPDPAGDMPDAYILCATTEAERAKLPHILVTLRNHAATRHAATLVIDADPTPSPPRNGQWAAHLLDMSVGDVVPGHVGSAELTLRLNRVLARKQQQDALRANVQTGLEAAVCDPLTGLYNRRYAEPHLTGIAEQAIAQRVPFAVMLVDVDHFKAVNDQHGHAAGDAVLVGLAERMRAHLRKGDMVARIGGEEFLAVLPRTHPEAAQKIAKRLCDLIRSHSFGTDKDGPQISITISVGLYVYDPEMDHAPRDMPQAAGLIAQADAALYRAKEGGRDQVISAQEAA